PNSIGRSGSMSKDLLKSVDLPSLPSVSLLIDLFLEQFNHYKPICMLPSVHGSALPENTSLEGYIHFHQKVCFNLTQMDECQLEHMFGSLVCFLRLLTTCNSILASHQLLRQVLVHDSHRFAEKLHLFFRQIFQLLLNEIKLFRLLSFRKQNNVESDCT